LELELCNIFEIANVQFDFSNNFIGWICDEGFERNNQIKIFIWIWLWHM